MSETQEAEKLLPKALVADEIFKLRPDYRALLIVVENIPTGPSDKGSESLLLEAETTARAALAKSPTVEIPHIAAWRDAYKAFAAKPTKARNNVEALTRRLEKPDGKLPRINRLTDIYNAISVKHHIPIGGEDLSKYVGVPVLVRATGEERFEAFAGGKVDIEHPEKAKSSGVTILALLAGGGIGGRGQGQLWMSKAPKCYSFWMH